MSSVTKNSKARVKNKYVCMICGDASYPGPSICSVNLHDFEDLRLNEKKNGYLGVFQKGAAHYACLESYILKDASKLESCVVCDRAIDGVDCSAMKLAVYVYRKRGCAAVLSIHEKCFQQVKIENFPLVRLPPIEG